MFTISFLQCGPATDNGVLLVDGPGNDNGVPLVDGPGTDNGVLLVDGPTTDTVLPVVEIEISVIDSSTVLSTDEDSDSSITENNTGLAGIISES